MYRVAQPPSRIQKGKKAEWNCVCNEMNERKKSKRGDLFDCTNQIGQWTTVGVRAVLFLFIFVQRKLWFCCREVRRCVWVMDAWLGVGKSIVLGCFATGCADGDWMHVLILIPKWSPSSHCCCWVEGKLKSFTEGKTAQNRQTKQLTPNYYYITHTISM